MTLHEVDALLKAHGIFAFDIRPETARVVARCIAEMESERDRLRAVAERAREVREALLLIDVAGADDDIMRLGRAGVALRTALEALTKTEGA